MIIIYVNCVRIVSKDTSTSVNCLEKYVLKEGIMIPTVRYLGDSIEKVQTENGSVMCEMHIVDYCKVDIANLEKNLNIYRRNLSQYGNVRCP